MKRRAYVGVSTPLFYDYSYKVRKTKNDSYSSPNPILDSPFGLFLLYDEVWFLCESLCPENLRQAPFVKFLDKENKLPDLSTIENKVKDMLTQETNLEDKNQNYTGEAFSIYEKTLIENGVRWESASDNHSHDLKVGNVYVRGNSMSQGNIMFDIEVVNSLELRNIEFITNSFTTLWFKDKEKVVRQNKLAELMIIDNIPNYVNIDGPYHPCIEEARNSNNLKAYRKWVVENSHKLDKKEINEVKAEVENELRRSQDEIFLKYFDPKKCFISSGKTIVGTGIDACTGLPISSGVSLLENMFDIYGKKNRRWQAFVIESRYFKK